MPEGRTQSRRDGPIVNGPTQKNRPVGHGMIGRRPYATVGLPCQKNTCSVHTLQLHSAMDLEVESRVVCPYCGAVFTTVVDTSFGTFSTIEDCEVCCRPIAVNVHCHCGEVESVEIDRA